MTELLKAVNRGSIIVIISVAIVDLAAHTFYDTLKSIIREIFSKTFKSNILSEIEVGTQQFKDYVKYKHRLYFIFKVFAITYASMYVAYKLRNILDIDYVCTVLIAISLFVGFEATMFRVYEVRQHFKSIKILVWIAVGIVFTWLQTILILPFFTNYVAAVSDGTNKIQAFNTKMWGLVLLYIVIVSIYCIPDIIQLLKRVPGKKVNKLKIKNICVVGLEYSDELYKNTVILIDTRKFTINKLKNDIVVYTRENTGVEDNNPLVFAIDNVTNIIGYSIGENIPAITINPITLDIEEL